jgi:uncharacterized membrane protein
MVLELKIPHGADLAALATLRPIFISYALSFVYVGIYWNNHHHMLHATEQVNGRILWANLHLLFWLSLIPFVTGWMGENHFAPWPVSLYGCILLLCGVAYFILSRALIQHHGEDSTLATAIGTDNKGKASIAIYAVAVPLSFVNRWLAFALYIAVAVLWFIPDPRIESDIVPED